MATQLLATELKRLKADPVPGIDGGPRADDLFLWDCTISGPPGTPWEGGNFQLTVRFPSDYPFRPPDVRFKTRVFHPNVYADGCICLDMLESTWTPSLRIRHTLLSIQSILDSPNLESPANPEAAKLYSIDRRQYNRKVRALSAATRHRIEDQSSSENGRGLNSEHPNNLNQAGPSNKADDLGSDFGLISEHLNNLNLGGPSGNANDLGSDFGLDSEHPDNFNQTELSNRANDLASDCGDGPASTSSARQERSQRGPPSRSFMRCFGCSKS